MTPTANSTRVPTIEIDYDYIAYLEHFVDKADVTIARPLVPDAEYINHLGSFKDEILANCSDGSKSATLTDEE